MSAKLPRDASTTTLLSRQLDRRAFLGSAGFAAGAVVAATLVPLSVVHALPSSAAVALTPAPEDPVWTGHVDDACGHWPPYAHAIPYDIARTSGAATFALAAETDAEPFDYILMV
ncbi:MAG: hypothetical protein WDO56_27490 [Gammaproteobacteria bacterium]